MLGRNAALYEMVVKRNPDETRERILNAAFEEIYRRGFRAASVDDILTNTGLTKGALYHHFPNKAALGYAVIEEIIGGFIHEQWIAPVDDAENPLDGLRQSFDSVTPEHIEGACTMGCPLNNLSQEMSPVDEGFRVRIEAVYQNWQRGVADRLEKGKQAGYVREDLDCSQAATFLIAAIEGATGLCKNSQNPDMLLSCMAAIRQFIDSMRPAAVGAST